MHRAKNGGDYNRDHDDPPGGSLDCQRFHAQAWFQRVYVFNAAFAANVSCQIRQCPAASVECWMSAAVSNWAPPC